MVLTFMRRRTFAYFGALACVALGIPHAGAAVTGPRWTDTTPDAMIDAQKARALGGKATERDALAAIATIEALESRAAFGKAQRALEEIGEASALPLDVREEAKVAARALAPDAGSPAGVSADRARGIVTGLALLGPFRDTGGGLAAKEGPEGPNGSLSDTKASYSWGTVEVAWRPVPATYATARGVPLDLFVHPRRESCSIVASRVNVDKAQPIVVSLAATGTARLMFDNVELARAEDVATKASFDRLAGRVDATAGAHVAWAKICTGALPDEGRVRMRLTDPKGAPLTLETTADLRGVPSGGKAKGTKVATALARALAVDANADPEQVLDAVVLRTLGGADDAKSPRAQGLLDGLTRKKDLDADRLAMAGWVAPSGANRSGWLNLAREKSEKEADAKANGFVVRRIIAEHLTAKMADWAMAALRGAKLDATDAEAVLIRAHVDQELGTDALRSKALRDLTAFFRANAKATPNAMVSDLVTSAAPFDPALALEASEELARRGLAGAHFVAARSQKGKQGVVDAAKLAFEGSLDDADEALRVAHDVSRAGAHDVARALYGRLVEWAPNRPETWNGLADEMAIAPDMRAGGAPVLAALRRARELSPGDARTRAELKLRSTEGDGESREDEKYIFPIATILARRQGTQAKGAQDVSARDLHFLRAVIMQPDNRVSQLIHYAREIVIAPRTQNELFEDIPVEGDLTEILRARVYRKDGGTAFPTEEHNEGRRPRIRWPDLAPGDVVEVAVRNWTSRAVGGRGDAPFYFLDYAGAPSTHPLLYNQDVIIAPTARPLYVDVINGQPQKRTERDENGRHIIELIWDKPIVVPEEPLAPQMSEIVPVVVGSTFKSWGDFRTWYAEAIRGFTEPDDEVRRLAAELTKGKRTKEEKLRALFNFVADDIRYVNYVSGEWWLPNRPQQLLARREGDCDDKAMLLITLLKCVGIDAQEVMVQTRMTAMPSVVLAKNTAIPMFDHGIAFLPGPNGGTYLDATSPQSRLGPIPSMDARATALRMDGPAEIVRLPSSSPEDHGAEVSWTITLHADGSGDLTGDERHVGDGAFWLRTYIGQPDGRQQYVEDNLVGGWFPTVEVDKKVDFEGDLPGGQAKVAYKAHSDGLARHEQGDLVVPISQSQTLASQLAPLVQRTQPVSLPPYFAPSHNYRTIRVVAPPGFHWGELPPGGDENGGEFGKAHLEFARDAKDPRVVVIKRNVTFDLDLIPPDKYPAWRAWIQRMDSLLHKGVRLLPGADVRGGK
jgi:Transglutaminase-like superfamily